jgi:hypothetical protein
VVNPLQPVLGIGRPRAVVRDLGFEFFDTILDGAQLTGDLIGKPPRVFRDLACSLA